MSYYLAQASSTGGNTATTSVPQAKNESKPSEQQGFGALWLPLVLVLVFYFVLIRPQQKKEKERQKMLKQLKKNDKVVTRGGLIGIVSSIKENQGIALLKVGEVKVEVMTNAIELINPEFEAPKTKK